MGQPDLYAQQRGQEFDYTANADPLDIGLCRYDVLRKTHTANSLIRRLTWSQTVFVQADAVFVLLPDCSDVYPTFYLKLPRIE